MKTLVSLIFVIVSYQVYSQSNLTVTYYSQGSNNQWDNNVSIDGSMIDYGICNLNPSFYISIIDTSCSAWGTSFGSQNSENNFGNYNNNGTCRSRVEYHFIYESTDDLQLTYMDSLLNYWIPENHVIVIYTPLGYDFTSLNTTAPELANTLVSKWGNAVQTDGVVVLFGVQGISESFSVDRSELDEDLIITKEICPYGMVLGIDNMELNVEKKLLKVVDLMGRKSSEKVNTPLIYIYTDGTTEKVFRVE